MRKAEDKAELIKMIASLPIGVDKIQVIEPSLEDIFVGKAGGEPSER